MIGYVGLTALSWVVCSAAFVGPMYRIRPVRKALALARCAV